MIQRSSINRKGVLIVIFLLTSFFAFSQKDPFTTTRKEHIKAKKERRERVQKEETIKAIEWEYNSMMVIDTLEVEGFNWGISPEEGIYIRDLYSMSIYPVPLDSLRKSEIPKGIFIAVLERTTHWPTATSTYILSHTKPASE